jgi:hypothetical protein
MLKGLLGCSIAEGLLPMRNPQRFGQKGGEIIRSTAASWDRCCLDVSSSRERYPEDPTQRMLELAMAIKPPPGTTTPCFVKVTQCDGQMARASPIYIRHH